MTIKVKSVFSYPQSVDLIVEGECKHVNTHLEAETGDVLINETFEDREYFYEVCDKCEAYRNAWVEGEWQGIVEITLPWGGL